MIKVDLTKTYLSEEVGKNIKYIPEGKDPREESNAKDITLYFVINKSLVATLEGDEKLSAEKKTAIFNLWFEKIMAAEGKEVVLEADDVVLIKERVNKAYASILIVAQTMTFLKGKLGEVKEVK